MTETQTPEKPPIKRLPGTPVVPRCGACNADLSPASMYAQIVLPRPEGDGIGFAPQMVVLMPLVCPACGEGQVRQQSLVVPGRGMS